MPQAQHTAFELLGWAAAECKGPSSPGQCEITNLMLASWHRCGMLRKLPQAFRHQGAAMWSRLCSYCGEAHCCSDLRIQETLNLLNSKILWP